MHMLHLAARLPVATSMFSKNKGGDAAPLAEIGTHGTMGNLLMKEIEYYKRLESNIGGDRLKNHGGTSDTNFDSGGSRFWSGFGFFETKWQKNKFLPRICIMMDATEGHHNHRQANKIPGFSYHNLEG
ncbi:uncharacterized protein LOC143531439 [Bidens hawaiensis]|uniref:uncharacterized protein LOC143531439 n=1 Tax=Bidens hawaiensis TaxID=980011 RepID=UPI004049A034